MQPAYLLMAGCGILSFLAIKARYYAIIGVVSGLAWWALAFFISQNPLVAAGDPVDVIAIMVFIFAGIGMMFLPVFADKFDKNGRVTGGSWRVPFMPTDDGEEANEHTAPTLQERNAIYQQRLDAASRGERRRR